MRRWLSGAGPDRAPTLLALLDAEARDAPASRAVAARAAVRRLRLAVDDVFRDEPPLSTQQLALDGRAIMDVLGTGPGPHVGEALRHLLDRVLDDPSQNTPAALAEAVRQWWAARL